MNKILLGALAGFAATVPMTILMTNMHRRLPEREQYPLPPREIIDELIETVEVDDQLTEAQKTEMSLAGHFAYGTTVGAVYPLLVSKPDVVSGAAYGLSVWAASYLGWLPAAGILRPATEHPARRNALMITAHVAWGAALGGLLGTIGEKAE